jgi:hypothetical protein
MKNKLATKRNMNMLIYHVSKHERRIKLLKENALALSKLYVEMHGKYEPDLNTGSSWIMKPHPLDIVNRIKARYHDLSKEELQIRTRLKLENIHKSMYSNQVESALDYYHDYISKYDWIDIENSENCLDRNEYLISPELYRSLMEGQNKYIDMPDIYIVVCTTIKNKENNVVLYNYIKYPGVFETCLLHYMIDTRILADYLLCLDDALGCDLPKFNKEYIKHIKDHTGIYPYNAINFLNRLFFNSPFTLDISTMSKIILFSKKDIYNVYVEIFSLFNWNKDDTKYLGDILNIIRNTKLGSYGYLNNCVFVVRDFKSFIQNINSEQGLNANQGLGKLNKTSNSLMNTIGVIDNSFRNSLWSHNRHHITHNPNLNIKGDFIPRHKFDYHNIHNKLGDIKF